MKVTEILNELSLGNSVAESDSRLDKYFVDTHTFNVLLSGRKDIVAGDKGTGKTALYRILMNRYRTNPDLKRTEIVTAFNPAGSPVFQQLLAVPVQTEGRYIAFWKTYFLSLIGNWMQDQTKILQQSSIRRAGYFLDRYGLRTIDTTPNGVFSRLMKLFPKAKSIEAEFGFNESGIPNMKPKIEFAQATSVQPPDFFGVDYLEGLRLLAAALKESDVTVWIALDRLDEAFLGYPGVEIPALRALLRTYLDLQAVSNIRLKLFLRNDLFRKVIAGGFVNLTHLIDLKVVIIWEEEDLKNLLIARVKDSPRIVEHLSLGHLSNDKAFAKLFPDKISQGEKQSTTWNWMMSRLKDGNGVIAPRNLIDLVEKTREAQLRSEARTPREFSDGLPLMEADSVRKAHHLLSEIRVQDTLLAEAPDLVPLIEKFRDKKAEQNTESLSDLLSVSEQDVRSTVKPLVEIGFLEEFGTSFKVPMLYREGLSITQGKASGPADNGDAVNEN
jgi:hypothetical protein